MRGTLASYRLGMLYSFVVRVDSHSLAAGGFSGELEEVDSGRRAVVRSVEEFLDHVRAHASAREPDAASR